VRDAEIATAVEISGVVGRSESISCKRRSRVGNGKARCVGEGAVEGQREGEIG
jgi:hypothetical protein